MLPGEERAHRLKGKLVEDGRALCHSEALLRHWAAAVPELAGTIDQLATLREAIDTLVGASALTVPRGRASWDCSFRPALPRFVLVGGVARARREQVWRETAWREEMGWAADLRTVTDGNLAHLIAINEWLVATRGGKVGVVPHRVRSAELLGDEKALDALSKTSLFGPGRLSWDLLASAHLEPPLAVRRVGAAGGVLVVENADPFWMAVEALDGSVGPVGLVAWGAGQSRSLPTLVREPNVTGPVWYWGDFDPSGLEIPAGASPAVEAAGLGPILPAKPLYEAMADHLDRAGPTAGRERWESTDRSSWLGPVLWARFAAVVAGGHRVAQEVVGPEVVTSASRRLGK